MAGPHRPSTWGSKFAQVGNLVDDVEAGHERAVELREPAAVGLDHRLRAKRHGPLRHAVGQLGHDGVHDHALQGTAVLVPHLHDW